MPSGQRWVSCSSTTARRATTALQLDSITLRLNINPVLTTMAKRYHNGVSVNLNVPRSRAEFAPIDHDWLPPSRRSCLSKHIERAVLPR